jgi:hypothetical protein
MKQVLLTLTCLLAFAVSTFAAEERVVKLPQDQGAWYLTVFGTAGDAKFTQVQSWLESDTSLKKLKVQVRYNQYTTDHVRYKRYATNMPGLPCIRIQDDKGRVVSEFWGSNIPSTSKALYRGIKDDLTVKSAGQIFRRRRPCPCPSPNPGPDPGPIVVPEPPVGPPILEPDPEPEPEESSLWLFLAALSALVGGGIGFAQEYKSEHKSSPTKL